MGHAAHFLGKSGPSWMHACHSTGFHVSLSLFTFIGPGRRLILDGLRSLFKGSPNMNTLVGLGALSSFAVSSVAALLPRLVSPNLSLSNAASQVSGVYSFIDWIICIYCYDFVLVVVFVCYLEAIKFSHIIK